MFISYAQNFEDVMLWRALKSVENGFYIDIGAQDPVSDSVSKAFHELGWRGVHVEPTAGYAQRLRAEREGDTVMQAIVGPQIVQPVIYQIEETGLSTTIAELAEQHAGNNFKIEIKRVESITLDDLLDMHKDRDVHWLKIDTEGSEPAVLGSWKNSSVRPWIIVVESIDPLTHEINSAAWEGKIFALGYDLAYFDGVNKFYVSHSHKELLKYFDRPPNLFDGFGLSGEASSPFVGHLSRKNQELLTEQERLSEQKAAIEEILTTERARFAETLQQSEVERGRLHAQIETQAAWWSAQLVSARAQLEAVHESTSWRVTAPLRLISRTRLAIIPIGRLIVSIMRRVVTGIVHRVASVCRRRFPRLFYQLATNRLTRRIFEMFRKPQHGQHAMMRPASAGSLTASLRGQGSAETLPALLLDAGNWKPGKRIDA